MVEEDTRYRERKEALLDSIRVQQDKVKEIDVEVDSKKKELANIQKLLDAGVGSRPEHTRGAGELDLLQVRRGNALKAAEEQTQELADLPQRHAKSTIRRLEADEAELESKAAVLKRGLDDNRREMVRIGELSSLEQTARRRLEQAENDVRSARVRYEALERLRDGAVTEFAAVQPAAVGSQPTSNRKTLGILTLGGLLFICFAGIIGHAWLIRSPLPPDPTFGLPVVGRSEASSGSCVEPSTEARRLALQLRDPIRDLGGIILFAAAEQGLHTDDIVWQLARYLSLAGEGVVIVDCRIEGASTTGVGLSNYLQRHVMDELAIIRTTDRDGVRLIPSGESCPDPDLLASAVMQKLLVKISQQWDRVLLIGPFLDGSLGAEILARYADGAVVVCKHDCIELPGARTAVTAIRNAGVPWVSAVVRVTRGETLFFPFAAEASGSVRATPTPDEELSKEKDGVLSVAWPQPARLGGNPPGPLKSETLNPFGGPLHSTDEHVKRSPDLKTYRGS